MMDPGFSIATPAPWLFGAEKLRQQDQNHAVGQFSWFYSEYRRVGGHEVLDAITDQLESWEPPLPTAN